MMGVPLEIMLIGNTSNNDLSIFSKDPIPHPSIHYLSSIL